MKYLTSHQNGHRTILTLNVEKLDASIAGDVKQEVLSSAMCKSGETLAIDMNNVTFIDSSGLGALVSVRKNLSQDIDVRIENANDFVKKILKLTKMDRVFSM